MRLERFSGKVAVRPLLAGVVVALAAAAGAVGQDTGDKADDAGWVQLFNGKDLTGWKLHPQPSRDITEVLAIKTSDGPITGYDGVLKDGKKVHLWRVENGELIGSGPPSHLFSEKEYDNFHYRIEAKINDGGNSGQYFRTQFQPGFPPGYEAQINATHRDPIRTGSLYLPKIKEVLVLNDAPHKADEYFTQEVIANGGEITILVNGKQTVKWTDPEKRFVKGHFALQGHDPGTTVTFKKIEYKPLSK